MKANRKVTVIGAGLTGATIARCLAEKGFEVTIHERRDHIAGNIFDYPAETGQIIQKYGPHIFHTNNEEVIKFVQRFGEWKEFKLECGASLLDKVVKTPFNFETIDTFNTSSVAEKIKKLLKVEFPSEDEVSILRLLDSSVPEIKEYASFLFEKDYFPYSSKQWGIPIEELDYSIFERVKVRLNYKTGYFSDTYQLMPKKSFSSFVEALLNHPKIKVIINSSFTDGLSIVDSKILKNGEEFDENLVYTGPIDELCQFRLGPLPYRSLRFDIVRLPIRKYQEYPVVAHPLEPDITRITEFKQLMPCVSDSTYIAKEYPLAFELQKNLERYYPVNTKESANLYKKYREFTSKVHNLTICGRLGDFKYYNMDQAIAKALEIANSF